MSTATSKISGSQLEVKSKKVKETLNMKDVAEREVRINYTLDMVVHDLVNQGHVHPAKSYLLKTPEMREHIGRMCDKLNRRKKEENAKARSYLSRSRTNSTRSVNTIGSSFGDKAAGESIGHHRATAGKPDIHENDHQKNVDANVVETTKNEDNGSSRDTAKIEPWVTPRDIVEESVRRFSANKRPENWTSSAPARVRVQKNLRVPSEVQPNASSSRNPAPAQAYRAKVDMSGFKNDEISLDLDDRRLVITAQRQKKGLMNARKVTEVIDIPDGVDLEHLKIGRRLDGTLLIEEFVPEIN